MFLPSHRIVAALIRNHAVRKPSEFRRILPRGLLRPAFFAPIAPCRGLKKMLRLPAVVYWSTAIRADGLFLLRYSEADMESD